MSLLRALKVCLVNQGASCSSRPKVQSSAPLDQFFLVDCETSDGDACQICGKRVRDWTVRVIKLDLQKKWYHFCCFVNYKEEFHSFTQAEQIPGFNELYFEETKQQVKEMFQRAKRKSEGDGLVQEGHLVKRKRLNGSDRNKEVEQQKKLLLHYRSELEQIPECFLEILLSHNNQKVPDGKESIINQLSDCMAFGALDSCKECGGQLIFNEHGLEYCCSGTTGQLKCKFTSQLPGRMPFQVPDWMKISCDFLQTYEYKKQDRVFADEHLIRAHQQLFQDFKKQHQLLSFYSHAFWKIPYDHILNLLEANGQKHPSVINSCQYAYDMLADCMVFGALERCRQCGGQLILTEEKGYSCTGNISIWSHCPVITRQPDRHPFVIPQTLASSHSFLQNYKYEKKTRIFPDELRSSFFEHTGEILLKDFKVIIVGSFRRPLWEVHSIINMHGGSVVNSFECGNVLCVVSTELAVKCTSPTIQEAKVNKTVVVSERFLDELPTLKAMKSSCNTVRHILSLKLSDWETFLEKLIPYSPPNLTLPNPQVIQQNLKVPVLGRIVLNESIGLSTAFPFRVLEEDGSLYSSVLCKVNVLKGKTSFYKLQVLESLDASICKLYSAWGDLETGKQEEQAVAVPSKEMAIIQFKNTFLMQTGNHWSRRQSFQKHTDQFYFLEVECGETVQPELLKRKSISILPVPVQELFCLVFDERIIANETRFFNLDSRQFPLGKISRSQLKSARSLLAAIEEFLKNTEPDSIKILDATNHFYTLVPHNFRFHQPSLINSKELVESKRQFVDALLDVDIEYIKEKSRHYIDILDSFSEQLGCSIEVLKTRSKAYKYIAQYLENTHAETHNNYELKIAEVYAVSRGEESQRYVDFKKFANRKLLWHGSRVENFARILARGLKISPSEAKHTGAMFGKGIYFADMVSKSANYCKPQDSNGLLLLCEVALGNMLDRTQSCMITRLPDGYHSVHGIGKTQPDPKKSVHMKGVEIPLGPPIKSGQNSDLLYNEYVVYDVAQVKISYLVWVNFLWKV